MLIYITIRASGSSRCEGTFEKKKLFTICLRENIHYTSS